MAATPIDRRARTRLARLRDALMTAAGRPRGFFVPYPHAASVADVSPAYPAVEAMMQAAEPAFQAVLDDIAGHREALAARLAEDGGPAFHPSWFPALDGAAAYALVRRLSPRQVIEVGSGHSSFFLAQALADAGAGGRMTCIDPAPRTDVAALDIAFERRILALEDVERFAALGPGDVCFIDSSHVLLPGMDVDILFNRVFPALAPGVVVHVHDVFLPDDYPATWRTRFYSEQNALIGWMLGGGFEPVFAAYYALTRMTGAAAAALGPLGEATPEAGGSLWLRRRG